MKKTLKTFVLFVLAVLAYMLLTMNTQPKYANGHTGSLEGAKGNPDNSYLDTTKIYCCGD